LSVSTASLETIGVDFTSSVSTALVEATGEFTVSPVPTA
jgi:hypothetical protein